MSCADSPASLPPARAQGAAAGANLRRLQKGGSRPGSAAGGPQAAAAWQAGAQPLQAQGQQAQGRRQQLEAAQERLQLREEARRRAARFVDCEAALSGEDGSGKMHDAVAPS
jgi:hypothetical protein